VKTKKVKESSRTLFQDLRPKFLDWQPPKEEEKALEVKARKDAREAELKRVTDLAKKRDVEKRAVTRCRSPG
jgi:hypothetical protein